MLTPFLYCIRNSALLASFVVPLQPVTKDFEIFLPISRVFFNLKWDRNKLFPPEAEWTSSFTRGQMTWDFKQRLKPSLPEPSFPSTILVIIFWDFLMLYQVFFSPQVKRIVIICNKHGIYELLQELPNLGHNLWS